MRIISIATAQDKIPTQFRGTPIPQEVIDIIGRIDQQYHLSYGEVEWIVESLEEEYQFFTSFKPSECAAVEMELGMVFDWSRIKQKSVIRATLQTAISVGKTYFLNEKIVQRFYENRKWAIAFLSNRDENYKQQFLSFDEKIPGGVTQSECEWIDKTFRGDIGNGNIEAVKNVIVWARATKVDLNTISYSLANKTAKEWRDYQRKLDLSKRISKKGLRSIALQNKWRAVWVDPKSVAKPKTDSDSKYVVVDRRDGIQDKREDYDYEVEQDIAGINLNGDKIISIRDPDGVPQAILEIGDETSTRIDVLFVEATEIAKQKVKEFVQKMKSKGVKLWQDGDAVDIESLLDLTEDGIDNYGLVTTVHLPNIGNLDGDSGSYHDAMVAILSSESSERSIRYFKKMIDNLVYYADQRDELHILGKAGEMLGDTIMVRWDEYQSYNDENIPSYPEEGDEEFQNEDGTVNEAVFSAASTAYYAEMAGIEEEFGLFKLSNYVDQTVKTAKQNSSNKALYEELDRKEQEQIDLNLQKMNADRKAQEEATLVREEAERQERERIERENERKREEFETKQVFKDLGKNIEIPDDFLIDIDD